MFKNISNLGNTISKKQQQLIQGGGAYCYGGCVNKDAGDACYTSSGGCRTRTSRISANFGGTLGCAPF